MAKPVAVARDLWSYHDWTIVTVGMANMAQPKPTGKAARHASEMVEESDSSTSPRLVIAPPKARGKNILTNEGGEDAERGEDPETDNEQRAEARAK